VVDAYRRTETLPTQYMGDFFSGAPGTNVPGIMPLMNQELVNRMMGFGVAGANPYTYSGQRIADFSPAEQESFRMTAEGMGSYLPYFQRGEQLLEQGVSGGRGFVDQAVGAGEATTAEGLNYLRAAPRIAGRATAEGMGTTRGALGMLGSAAGTGESATRGFDPSGIGGFYNPYEDAVVQQTMEDVRTGLDKGLMSQNAQAVGAGAFGGSRGRLRNEELAEATARGAAQQVGAIRAGGYQDASRRAQAAFESQQARRGAQANLLAGLGAQQANIGGQLAGMGGNLAGLYGTTAGGIGSLGGNLANIYGGAGRDAYGMGAGAGGMMANFGQGVQGALGTDIARMQGMGGLQRGMDQRAMDLAYGNFVGEYNLPMQTIGQMGQTAAGFSPALGGTTLTSTQEGGGGTNPLMQAAGTALTAYGAFQPRSYGYGPAAPPATLTGGGGINPRTQSSMGAHPTAYGGLDDPSVYRPSGVYQS
jgi:hypothetical protein